MISQLYLKLLLLSCRYIICNLCYIFPNVYFKKKLKLKSLTDTCYSVPAASPAPAAAHVPAAGGSSARGPGTSHDPGGPAVGNLQPPPIYRYPSFNSSLG